MFLHLGGGFVVSLRDLIMIINLETGQRREATREFLSFSAEEQQVVEIGDKRRQKSAVITDSHLVFSPISSLTLFKRATARRPVSAAAAGLE